MYCPYIADAFITANDTAYFNMSGVLMYDAVISHGYLQSVVPAAQFVNYWSGLFPFNDTFRADMYETDKNCGFTKFIENYLVYPPKGNMPNRFPGEDDDGQVKIDCIYSLGAIMRAIMSLNPCFNIYQITTMCPLLWDVVGFPGTVQYLPDGAQIVSVPPPCLHLLPEFVCWDKVICLLIDTLNHEIEAFTYTELVPLTWRQVSR
jgi:carboxypeptidase D